MSTVPAPELAESYAEGAMVCHVADGQIEPMLAFQYDQGESLIAQLASADPIVVAKVVTTVIRFLPNPTHVTFVAATTPEDWPTVALVVSFDLTWPGKGAWRTIIQTDVPAGFVVEGSNSDPGDGTLVEYVRLAIESTTITRDDPPAGATLADVLRTLAHLDLLAGGVMSSDPRLMS